MADAGQLRARRKRQHLGQGDPPVLHGPYSTWTRSVNGKTVTRKITEEQRVLHQAWFDNARKLRQLVNDLEILSLEASGLERDGGRPPR